ncbi:hypothetical protein [Flagellimonas aequoris]|uniref:Uncharacterized protein n=1 Tax=Flagellimonas aequoris TaxID=2306997 RepID=A0A418N4Z8_9FLAO|nr:hypothetical protein [Allomuricauda aequoris]RIV68866.1 hypothetical protein D2U88_16985 [Allomuricauda aequoris]TXK00568.1 hypothetical protein FQ019_16785 [Allomuricauda aequoris]
MKTKTLTLLAAFFASFCTFSQSPSIEGTFLNSNSSISIQFKQMGDEYHGMLATAGASFAIRAEQSANRLTGKIFGLNGPIDFTAQLGERQMLFAATGYNETFYKYSDEHNLAGYDLTPYMVDYGTGTGQNSNSNAPQAKSPSAQNGLKSPYPDLNNQEVYNIVSGSQLVYYQRTSYVNDNTGSSITYVNFCSNGTFTINYDGSFSVEGDYGGNVHGASRGSNSGYWKLVSYQGQPAVYLLYYNGQSNVNPFNINDVKQGRWRRGNTQYALQRNKVSCN